VLRAEAPAWRHPANGWALTTHALCAAAAADDRMRPAHRTGRAAFDDMDPSRYQAMRKLLTPALSATAMRGIENEVRWRAEQIVVGATRRGQCDLVTDVAAALPFQTIALMLGVPDEDRPEVWEWLTVASEDADRALLSYGAQLIAGKSVHPGADLVSKAIYAHLDNQSPDHDHLDPGEVLMLFDTLIAAGSQTTRDAIAAGVLALAEHPDEWRRLRDERKLLRSATEEVLRWASPRPCDQRVVTADLLLDGHRLRAGERVDVWWASANRDETVFADPSRFDVGRNPNPHLAFGVGGHACLGATVARMEIRLLLDVLLDHVSEVTIVGPPQWSCSPDHTSLRHLPVTLTP
ncbi:MAG: cytochrome P450, partial [Acidimicrobiales bacterium]